MKKFFQFLRVNLVFQFFVCTFLIFSLPVLIQNRPLEDLGTPAEQSLFATAILFVLVFLENGCSALCIQVTVGDRGSERKIWLRDKISLKKALRKAGYPNDGKAWDFWFKGVLITGKTEEIQLEDNAYITAVHRQPPVPAN